MEYLLDTNTYIWLSGNQKKLSSKTINMLSSAIVHVSILSLWEIQIKQTSKNVKMVHDALLDPDYIAQQGFQLIPLKPEHIFGYGNLQYFYDHRDPFDRMLIAQAIHENLPIITSDEKFAQYKDVKVIVN